jgi:hypothetical protein
LAGSCPLPAVQPTNAAWAGIIGIAAALNTATLALGAVLQRQAQPSSATCPLAADGGSSDFRNYVGEVDVQVHNGPSEVPVQLQGRLFKLPRLLGVQTQHSCCKDRIRQGSLRVRRLARDPAAPTMTE